MVTLCEHKGLTIAFDCNECCREYMSNEYIMEFEKRSFNNGKTYHLSAWVVRSCPKCRTTNTEFFEFIKPQIEEEYNEQNI